MYQKEFKDYIKDQKMVATLVADSFISPHNLETFERLRKFETKLFNKNGSVLDIGSANGFFLKCLQEWSKYELIPYGIDTNPLLIRKAKGLFPKSRGNFVTLSANYVTKKSLLENHLPDKYDFVHFGVWDNWEFRNKKEIGLIHRLLKHVAKNGRLILRFDDPVSTKNLKRVQILKKAGYKLSRILKNKRSNNIAIWIGIR